MKYKLGTAIFVIRNNHILIGKRNDPKKRGYGEYNVPGGKVDPGENIRIAAARELFEETNLIVNPSDLRIVTFTDNLISSDNVSTYLTLYFYINLNDKQEPINTEPHKCTGWQWVSMANSEYENYNIWDNGVEVIKQLRKIRQWD